MVFYTLTVIFFYVSTKWLFQKISIPPMGEINNPPLPFYGHPAEIQDILYMIPLFLRGRWKFPLWVKYGSFLERPKNKAPFTQPNFLSQISFVKCFLTM